MNHTLTSLFAFSLEQTRDEKPLGQLGHSKQAMMRDRRLQGRDKRFVVDLARNTHTVR